MVKNQKYARIGVYVNALGSDRKITLSINWLTRDTMSFGAGFGCSFAELNPKPENVATFTRPDLFPGKCVGGSNYVVPFNGKVEIDKELRSKICRDYIEEKIKSSEKVEAQTLAAGKTPNTRYSWLWFRIRDEKLTDKLIETGRE